MLEHGEIQPIVRCYHQLARLNQMVETLRDEKFEKLTLDRKENAMKAVTKLEVQAEAEILAALRALERVLNLPDDEKMDTQIRRAAVNRER